MHQVVAGIGLQIFYLLFVTVKQRLEDAGQVLKVQAALVVIGQHSGGAVFAGDDDPTAAGHVERIVVVGASHCLRGLGMGQGQVGGSKASGGTERA